MQKPQIPSPTEQKHSIWFFVTFVVLISSLGSFVNDMFTPALPEMCRFFHTKVSTVQMGLTTGMIGLAVGQFVLGPMSDHYGRKPVLLWAMGLFVVAAIISVFSPTIEFFIVCRLFQGLGASAAYLSGKSMPADRYSGMELAKIMAIIGAINGFAPASAPIFGGLTAQAFGWKGIFVVLAIFTALLMILSRFVSETLPLAKRSQGPWYRAFRRYKIILTNKNYMVHVGLKGMSLGILFAYISASPFILESHYGLSETIYGLVVGFNAIFQVTSSMLAPRIHPLKRGAWIGAWIVVIGMCVEIPSLLWIKSVWVFEAGMVVILFGLGFLLTVTNTLAMNEGRNQAGEASSILGIAGYIVGAVVSPLVGIGDVLRSTAITFGVLTVLTLLFALWTKERNCDLLPTQTSATTASK